MLPETTELLQSLPPTSYLLALRGPGFLGFTCKNTFSKLFGTSSNKCLLECDRICIQAIIAQKKKPIHTKIYIALCSMSNLFKESRSLMKKVRKPLTRS